MEHGKRRGARTRRIMDLRIGKGKTSSVFVDPPFMAELETAVRAGFNIMLTGPRGTGKTTAVKEIAKHQGKKLYMVSTPFGTIVVSWQRDAR